MKSILAISFLSLIGGSLCFADTPLQITPSQAITIQGQSPTTATIQALAYYTPSFNYDPSLDAKKCDFQEDFWNPNGSNRALTIKAVKGIDGASYAVTVPTQGLRGACGYSLQSIDLIVDNPKVYESIRLETSNAIRYDQKLMGDLAPTDIASFTTLTEVACEFSTSEPVGICSTASGEFLDQQYQISSSPMTYNLNFTDK